MYKITNSEHKTIGVHTTEDVYNEVKRITGSIYCAAAAKRWAEKRDRAMYSLADYWDEQVRGSNFGAVVVANVPDFRIVAI